MKLGKIFKAFAGTLLGVAAGFLFGPGAFSATAYAIGSLLGGFLFNRPDRPKPRGLDNLNIGGSAYGAFIPIIYGGVPDGETTGGFVMAGNIIDAKTENAITEVRYDDKINWFLTFAVLFADCTDGTPRIIDKLWAYTPSTNFVLYERGATTGFQLGAADSTGMETGAWLGDAGQKLTLSRGTGNQVVPDAFDALHGGTGCPYRWQTVAWFENFFIGNSNNEGFGGQPPTIRALVRDGRTGIAEIIEGHLVRAKIPADKIDLSNIPADKEIAGCAQVQKEGARELCDKLAAIAFCDLVRVGDMVTASDRTNPVIIPVDANDLGAHTPDSESPPRWFYTQSDKVRQPSKFNLRFIDPALNYLPNTTTAVRGVGETYSEESFELEVVMSFAQATQLARIMLDEAIAASIPYKEVLPSKYINSCPGDVLEFSINGVTRQIRITEQGMGSPGPLQIDAVSYDAGVYQNIEEVEPVVRPGVEPVNYDSEVLLWDMNTARDVDVDAGPGGVLYGAATKPNGASFRAVTLIPLFQSAFHVGFRNITFNTPAVVGTAQDALDNTSVGSNQWDEVSTVQVAVDGELTSADDEEDILENGTNLAALKCGTNYEIFHFRDVTFDGTSGGQNLYTLSHFLRGQRGTEGMIAGHATGNTFILLNAAVKTIPLFLPPMPGNTVKFTREDTSELVQGTVYQHSLKPFSPVQIQGERDGSNNLTITWSKRSKYTDYSDHSGVPPRNARDDRDWFYIDIYSGLSIVAQFTSSATVAGSNGATLYYLDFSAAQQSAAGLTPGDPVTVKIYQGNNIISRGYAGTATI